MERQGMGARTVSDIPPPPPGFTLVDEPAPRAPRRTRSASGSVPPPPPGFSVLPDDHPEAVPLLGKPTGAVHDGDTFALDSGQNARLYGVDAFELNQTGRTRAGVTTPLGREARNALAPYAQPDALVTPTGAMTYGRPVASLDRGGDAATDVLRQGYGIATPDYLKADPERLGNYMEAERDARLNRRGAWAGSFEQPASYRHGTPDPWAKPVAGKEGESSAVFWDEALPAQGLRPEIADGWIALHRDPTSTADDIKGYAKANGFQVDEKDVDRFIRDRSADPKRPISDELSMAKMPRVLSDQKDGTLGAALRGFADPFNVLDETGAVADTLFPGTGRENVWSSDRRFGDVYANNLDQNRSVLAFDDAKHPYARFGGQLVGGLVAPGASIEGVGFGAARGVLEAGGTRFAAEQAAKRAVVTRLGVAGGAEGAAAGIGQGEDWKGRVQGGLIGAPLGVALGVGTGFAAPHIAKLVGRPFRGMAGAEAERSAQDLTDGALDAAKAGTQNGATPGTIGTADDAARLTDNVPPPPSGYRLLDEPTAVRPADPEPTVRLYRAEGDATNSRQGIDTTEGHRWFTTDPDIAANYASKRRGEVYALDLPKSRANDLLKGGYTANIPDGEAAAMRQFTDLKAARAEAEADIERGSLSPDDYKAHVAERLADERSATQAMNNEAPAASIDGPSFVDDVPPPPPGFTVLDNAHPDAAPLLGEGARARLLLDPATESLRRAQAEDLAPGDVLPVPRNYVGSIEEAEGIAAGRVSPVRAPNEADALERRNVPNANTGTPIPKRGPLDMVTWLRSQGGIRAQGGELERYGIDNAPRKGVDFAGGENRFGPLVSNEGMNYDDAAQRAWEAGFFPDHVERPTVAEFLDTLNATHSGNNRAFRADDLPEINAFERARSERYEVEAARQEGAPLMQDRGEPIGADDLDRNAPPVEAYEEWGENAPTLAGNIRLDKLDSPQSIARAIAHTNTRVGGFDAATRGRITHAETERLAGELGMTADDLLKRRKGQALNAEEALASRQILARSATDLVNMAKRIKGMDNPGEEVEAAFKEAWLRHVAIQEQVSGMTAEAGRALSAFRMAANASAVDRVLPTLGDIRGGSARLKDVADRIVDLEASGVGPGGVNTFTAKAIKPRFQDKLIELYYNSLLSGPQTHVTNMLGNTLTAIGQIPEHALAAAVGGARRAVGRGDADRVLFSEIGARSVGMIQGAREGMAAAAKTLRTGEAADAVTKLEQQTQYAISGVKGSIIRTPTRFLSAEDEFFKGIARRMELAGMSVREAAKEGHTGAAAKARAAELLANPTDDMLARSFEYGRYLTFQNALGPVGRHVTAITEAMPALKLILPFVRTPTNILKFAVERSPLAPLMKTWRNDLRSGGAKADLAIARAMVGTGVAASIFQLAQDGKITGGGPADREAKRLLQRTGWQPYSFKIGDKYVSYQRLDPYSTTIGTAADIVDLQRYMTDKQRDDSAMLVGTAILHNLGNKTWLSGLSDALEALNDPDRSLQNFSSRMTGSIAVPAIVAQAARTADPVLREARAPLDRIRSRVPGLSSGLFPRRDAFGRAVTTEGGLGPDIVSPIWTSTNRPDPTVDALLEVGAHVTAPSKKIAGRELTPAEYDKWQVVVGQTIKPELDALVNVPGWKQIPADERKDMIDDTVRKARRAAKAEYLGRSANAGRIPPPPPGFAVVQ